MQTIIPILIFILILGIVIFIHELGHFLAARRAGIFVEEFALGMGPKIFSKKGKKKSIDGETTLFSLRAFPVGGFCRMRGMDEEMPEDPEAMNNKPVSARMLVMAGGSIMNFLLAFALFFILIMVRGTPLPESEIFINEVTVNMPGYVAGLRAGDIITHVNDIQVASRNDVITMIIASGGEAVDMRVIRDGVRHDFSITPIFHDERFMIGFTLGLAHFRPARIHEGIFGSAEMIALQITGPFRLLSQLLAGEQLAEGEGIVGFIGIGGMITEAYEVTIKHSFGEMLFTMIFFTAAINAALGVMNLLPIPALDGARIIFLLIEVVRRKPIPPEKEAMVHMVGLVSLLLLAVFIAYRDIARLVNL